MMKNLLFFFTDEGYMERVAATCTLAWLAKNVGVDFDAHLHVMPETLNAETIHMENFIG